jgi:hypothetical protein
MKVRTIYGEYTVQQLETNRINEARIQVDSCPCHVIQDIDLPHGAMLPDGTLTDDQLRYYGSLAAEDHGAWCLGKSKILQTYLTIRGVAEVL